MSVKKVLIIRFSSIGDIVLTTPVIRAVKTQLDNAEVHFCTKEKFRGLIENNPYVDKVLCLGGSISSLIAELKKENYDYIIDLHSNLRTRIIKLSLRVPSASFNKLNYQKWLMVNYKINRLPNVHIVDRYLETAKKLGVKKDELGLDYFIPERDEIQLNELPDGFQNEYVVYAIGGNHNTKKLPVVKMIELCDKINRPVILLGGKEDFANGEKVASFFAKNETDTSFNEGLDRMNKKTTIFNACGKFNLNQSASVIKKAKVVFSHDTGMMHIAAAFKKEIFSIWGNTTPDLGMYPYKTKFTVFERNGLPCRPCSKIGYDKCPKGHFKCMNEQVFDFYLP